MIFFDPEFKEIVASVRPRLNFSNGNDMSTGSLCPAGAEDSANSPRKTQPEYPISWREAMVSGERRERGHDFEHSGFEFVSLPARSPALREEGRGLHIRVSNLNGGRHPWVGPSID
jgi:hypothetical protein